MNILILKVQGKQKFIYFPWAFKIPTTIITPHTAPTIKEPELTAKAHIVAAAPDNPPTICWLRTNAGLGVGAGQTSLGFSPFFGRSFATAGNTGASSVTPKILKTSVNHNNKYFRLDLGLLLAL